MNTFTCNRELSARMTTHRSTVYIVWSYLLPPLALSVDRCPIFSDTKHERNKLMESAYPKIKSFCQDLGYDFQVVDMRWGVRDQATDDNMGTEMCLRELQMCQKLSTGPNFVVSFFYL